MNVLIINASPRKNGVTSKLLAEAERSIGSKHGTEFVRIQDLTIRPCIGCLKCRPDKTCVLPHDGAHLLAGQIKKAELLILGSPVYWGNMPGSLKIFFDRNVTLFEYCEAKSIRYIPKPRLKGKRALLIISGASPFPFNLMRTQSRGTIQSLKTILKAGGVNISSVLSVPDTYNFEKKKQRHLRKVARIVQKATG